MQATIVKIAVSEGSSVVKGDLLLVLDARLRVVAINPIVAELTGYAPEDGGEVRLLTLETLKKHPEDTWHPNPSNPSFLGYFRWKIAAG